MTATAKPTSNRDRREGGTERERERERERETDNETEKEKKREAAEEGQGDLARAEGSSG